MRKLFLFFLVFLLLVPVNVFGASIEEFNGGKRLFYTTSNWVLIKGSATKSKFNALIDNDLSTFYEPGRNYDTWYVDLGRNYDIKGIRYAGSDFGDKVLFEFLDSNNNVIQSIYANSSNFPGVSSKNIVYKTLDLKSVRKFRLSYVSPYWDYSPITELMIYGNPEVLSVQDYSIDLSNDRVRFNFVTNRPVTNDDNFKLKFLDTEFPIISNTFILKPLEPGEDYSIELMHLDSNFHEVVDFRTLSNADVQVKNVNYKRDHESIEFNWSNPIFYDFGSVTLLRKKEGETDYKTVVTTLLNSYKDTGLSANTKYYYKFVVNKLDGSRVESFEIPVVTSDVNTEVPPPPTGITVTSGSRALLVNWQAVKHPNTAGYNVYVNGVKHNSKPVSATGNGYKVFDLENDVSYSIQLTTISKYDGTESDFSETVIGVPGVKSVPVSDVNYELKDIVNGTSSWFNSLWLVIAFSISIPLAFLISGRIKGLFTS